MTIFSVNPHDRRIERFMTAIPNFKPRGVGVRFSESQILIAITTATPTEILAETMRQIRCPPFRKRFNEYIESEETPMTYLTSRNRESTAINPAPSFTSPSTAALPKANRKTSVPISNGARLKVLRKVRLYSNIRTSSATARARTGSPKSSPKKPKQFALYMIAFSQATA